MTEGERLGFVSRVVGEMELEKTRCATHTTAISGPSGHWRIQPRQEDCYAKRHCRRRICRTRLREGLSL